MKSWTKLKAVGLVALLVGFGLVVGGTSQAAAGSVSDPTGDATGGASTVLVDVVQAAHSDDATGNFITWSFDTTAPITNASVDTAQWDLDVNSNGTYGEAADACIAMSDTGTVLRAALKPGCGGFVAGTADATITSQGTGSRVSFNISNAFFRSSVGFTTSSYHYKLTTHDTNGWADLVPNTGDVTHSSVAAAAPTPSAVQNLTATAGNTTASVSWSAPATGGASILTYSVQRQVCSPGCANQGSAQTVNAPTTTLNDSGLTNGTVYRYVVTATNGTASGPSANSNQTSFGPPSAPSGVTGVPGNGQITVSWSAPSSNGGSAITSYQVTASPAPTGGQPPAVTGSPPATSQVVTGLTNGTTYTFTVHATNVNGNGPESSPSAGVAPTSAQASASPQAVTVAVQGVISIARATGSPDTINFGTVTKGINPADQDAGGLDYTNTLTDDNAPWHVDVQATNLTRGGGCTLTPSSLCTIPYGNMTYKPAQTISADSGSQGTPVAASNGAFTGTGSTSLPKSISTAAQGTYGTFHQPDPGTTAKNMLGLVVPLSVRPGAYNGTLTYTITG